MKALVIKPFIDKKEGVTRNQGDTFILSKERLKEINSTKIGELVVGVAEVATEEAAKPKRKPKKG